MNNVPQNGRIAGLILAGGSGQRMNGRDKGLLPWHGQPLIAQVAARLRPQVNTLYISCNRNMAAYAGYADRVFSDAPGYGGPLAGLYSLPAATAPLLLLTPCDTPLVPRDLATTLLQALEATPHADIAYATAEGSSHYLHALLRHRALATLPAYLAAGGRAVKGWYARQHVVTAEFDAAYFLNCNTPDSVD